jgi:hypothetical protein
MGGRRTGIQLGLLVLAGMAISLAAPGAALGAAPSEQGQVNLALLPVGQSGSYFDITMSPGSSRSFAVDIANNGATAVAARTYAADVYTIINGGFGARLRGEAQSGMTAWLTYPTKVWTLAPGQGVRRTFAVHVPANAAPGETITSLVLENDQPIRVPGAGAVNQVVRQAVAMVVTVPGPRAPALAIGDASIAVVGGRSVVSVAVANIGNIRLSPEVDFALLDASGNAMSASSFQMGTFYAGTSTFIEVALTSLLPPGAYVARVTLRDPAEQVSVGRATPAVLAGGPDPSSPGDGQTAGQVSSTLGTVPGSAPWVVHPAAGAFVALGIFGVIVLRRRRRHAGRGTGRPAGSAPAAR